MPKISIIVPVYNKGEFIKSCLESILKQTYKDFELIVINDGSTDNSGHIIDKVASSDSRIVVIHQENGGVSSARNAGLSVAIGDYIGFVDADDLLEDDMYELLVENIEVNNADISICGVKRIFPNKQSNDIQKPEIIVYDRDQALTKFFKGEILMSTYEKLFRKELVSNLSYRPALYEDTFYNFEAIKAAKKIVYDSSQKYKYIIRDNSHSMANYGPKFLNTAYLSYEMVKICEKELERHLEEVKSFDFNLNMFLLNLIYLNKVEGEKIHHDYNFITSNLKKYNKFYKSADGIKSRYRLGYGLFLISPKLYFNFLKLYIKTSKSEHNTRTKKKELIYE